MSRARKARRDRPSPMAPMFADNGYSLPAFLTGNSYAEIERDPKTGEVVALHPLAADRVSPPTPPALPDWPATRAAFARGDLPAGVLADMLEEAGDERYARVRTMKVSRFYQPHQTGERDVLWCVRDHPDTELPAAVALGRYPTEAAAHVELRRRVLALLGG